MSNVTRIFISYHKKSSEPQAEKLEDFLDRYVEDGQKRFEVWRDSKSLEGGEDWAKEIGLSLYRSDVVIVLVGKETPLSSFVRKEIMLAQKLNIAILCLGHNMDNDLLTAQVKKLGLQDYQYINLDDRLDDFKDTNSAFLKGKLPGAIDNCRSKTHELLGQYLDKALKRAKSPAGQHNPKQAQLSLKSRKGNLALYLAVGDVIKTLDNIHVLVNSENNYMQMARIFEKDSVSSTLRWWGATRGKVFRDTLQQEIDQQLKGRSRPISTAEVIVTGAGELKTRGVKNIFHVASVLAREGHKDPDHLTKFEDIQLCVMNCLLKVDEINKTRKRSHLRSIVFPLFGTGTGGETDVTKVVKPMLDAIKSYLDKHKTYLEEIYISVYHRDDYDAIISSMEEKEYLQAINIKVIDE